jgi:hypothetical protein
MTKSDKIILLERAIEVFHEIEKPKANDYMILIVTVARVRHEGTGLTWVEVKEALEGIVDYNY